MCSLNKSTHSNLSDYPLGTQLHYFPLPLLQWTAINAMVPEGPVSQKWTLSPRKIFFLFFLNFILLFNFTILYWFCHISTWILHRYTHVPHPEPSSLFPPHTIPLGRPSAPRCPSANEWIRKLWYIYTMAYYSAIKKNTFESVLMRWMKLEPIIQSAGKLFFKKKEGPLACLNQDILL